MFFFSRVRSSLLSKKKINRKIYMKKVVYHENICLFCCHFKQKKWSKIWFQRSGPPKDGQFLDQIKPDLHQVLQVFEFLLVETKVVFCCKEFEKPFFFILCAEDLSIFPLKKTDKLTQNINFWASSSKHMVEPT